MQYTVYSMPYTVCRIQYTVCSIQYAVYNGSVILSGRRIRVIQVPLLPRIFSTHGSLTYAEKTLFRCQKIRFHKACFWGLLGAISYERGKRGGREIRYTLKSTSLFFQRLKLSNSNSWLKISQSAPPPPKKREQLPQAYNEVH